MTVKQEGNLNLVFLLMMVVFSRLHNYDFFKIHIIMETCLLMVPLAGMIFLRNRKLLRAKQNGEPLTRHYMILGIFTFVMVIIIGATILQVMGHYELR